MTKKIFLYSFLVGVLALLLSTGLFFGLQYRQNLDEAAGSLRQETYYVSHGVEESGLDYLTGLKCDRRVVWMDADGRILFTDQAGDVSNLGETAEIQAALKDGIGQASRKPDGENMTYVYCAHRLKDGSVLRLSMPLPPVQAALATVSPVLWVFVLVLAISGTMAFRAARQIVRPINELDLD
ncbi:MAG: hypothetical protein J5602_11225, partial [Clostridia bacterium]|nr:hypothetical protein [Clostridia bacterium]